MTVLQPTDVRTPAGDILALADTRSEALTAEADVVYILPRTDAVHFSPNIYGVPDVPFDGMRRILATEHDLPVPLGHLIVDAKAPLSRFRHSLRYALQPVSPWEDATPVDWFSVGNADSPGERIGMIPRCLALAYSAGQFSASDHDDARRAQTAPEGSTDDGNWRHLTNPIIDEGSPGPTVLGSCAYGVLQTTEGSLKRRDRDDMTFVFETRRTEMSREWPYGTEAVRVEIPAPELEWILREGMELGAHDPKFIEMVRGPFTTKGVFSPRDISERGRYLNGMVGKYVEECEPPYVAVVDPDFVPDVARSFRDIGVRSELRPMLKLVE